jgi:tryptophanyl-tRNA synthetase
VCARVMDLQHPQNKMSKSVDSPLGTVGILDDPKDIERKVKRAVTDTETEVAYDVAKKPGVSNLLELLAASTGVSIAQAAARYQSYGQLKTDTAEAVVAMLTPVRERTLELRADLGEVERILADGAARAHRVAEVTYATAAKAIGLFS